MLLSGALEGERGATHGRRGPDIGTILDHELVVESLGLVEMAQMLELFDVLVPLEVLAALEAPEGLFVLDVVVAVEELEPDVVVG